MAVENSTGFPELDEALRATEKTEANGSPDPTQEPKTERSKRGAATPPSPRERKNTRSISVRVTKQVSILGAGIDLLDRDGVCGNVVMDTAEDFGIALENVSKENPRIAKILEDGIESAAWINLFLVVAGMITPIAQQHFRPRRRRERVIYEDEGIPGIAGTEPATTESEANIPHNGSAAAIGGLPWSGRAGESFPL
jgi:hypothetical protein